MPRIMITYRRDDSAAITGRIFDRLTAHYGSDSVFRDIDAIPLGRDYRDYLAQVLDQSDIVLVIIGPRWRGQRGGGNKAERITSPSDPVRLEVEAALDKRKIVIPVLVLRSSMPRPEDLPPSLRELTYRNAIQLDAGREFDVHMERLVRAMDRILETTEETLPALPNIDTAAPEAPRVFRAGDPIQRDREAFVPRFVVLTKIESFLKLEAGCPALLLYGRRRTGKSTILRNLVGFLPNNVRVIEFSMLDPRAFTSTKSLCSLMSDQITTTMEWNSDNNIDGEHVESPTESGALYKMVASFLRSGSDRLFLPGAVSVNKRSSGPNLSSLYDILGRAD